MKKRKIHTEHSKTNFLGVGACIKNPPKNIISFRLDREKKILVLFFQYDFEIHPVAKFFKIKDMVEE